MNKGMLAGLPVKGVRVVVYDGASHLVDSSEHSFRLAAQGAFQQGGFFTNLKQYKF